jgi:HEAT repeat protein
VTKGPDGKPPDQGPAPPPQPPAKKQYSDAELTQLLEDLKSTDFFRKNGAVEKLNGADAVAKRRKEVARALEPLLVPEENVFVRRNTGHALAVWGDADSVPVLLKRIGKDEGDIFMKQIVIETLGTLKDERAAEPLAECLNDFFLRGHAIKALKTMGSVAEKAVLKQLESSDVGVRIEACKILQEVGTKASLTALEFAAKDSNAGYAKAATDAMQAIKERK